MKNGSSEKDVSNYAGGLYLKNMQYISNFDGVDIHGLKAVDGGAIYVGIDEEYRDLDYNSEIYNFTNVQISNCTAENGDGGGFRIENVRNMRISSSNHSYEEIEIIKMKTIKILDANTEELIETKIIDVSNEPEEKTEEDDPSLDPSSEDNGEEEVKSTIEEVEYNITKIVHQKWMIRRSSIVNSTAKRGAGIFYSCEDRNLKCDLLLDGLNITNNSARDGGGLYIQDIEPRWDHNFVNENNSASLYGNLIASYPI